MNKQEFLAQLRSALSGLPEEDVIERLTFYSEMIDDRMEDGLPEEDAVRAIGSVDALVPQILADIPLSRLVKQKIPPKNKLSAWAVILLALGSPIWLCLLLALFAVVLSLTAAFWAVLISLWAVFAAIVICAPACAAAGVAYAVRGDCLSGFALIGAGLICAGLAVFLFFGCRAASKGVLMLTRFLALRLKNCFIKKEVA